MHRLSGWRRTRRTIRGTRRTAGVIFVAGLAVAATVVPLPRTGPARADIAGPAPGPAAPWDRDALKVAATSDLPTFGGAYLDDDGSTLHVWLTRPTVDGALQSRSALAAAFGARVAGDGIRPPVVHQADYSFAQLKAWRDAARTLLPLPGMTMLDIDERANRLVVEVADTGRHGPAVTAGLDRLGVPRAAVNLRRGAPAIETLGDKARPVLGGIKIDWRRGTCSLGFIAQRQGLTGFVTNAHCSEVDGGADAGQYWQPTRPADLREPIGGEKVDPPYTAANPLCPAGRKCRVSDANFVTTVASVGVSQGQIARPQLDSASWNGTDTFRIVNVRETRLNAKVQKVGHVTGRTSGVVISDCFDTPVAKTPNYLFCQDMADYKAETGDSGGPVFEIVDANANTVALVGIHWGIKTFADGTQAGLYSPFSNVEAELGNLSVCFNPTTC